jgi:large subunit ribosomal protein L25
MQTLTLAAEPRQPGKSTSKALRRAERVPAVLYGPHAEPVHFSVAWLDLRPLIHTTETYRVSLRVDGEAHDCILKHVDYDPLTSLPAHVDFFALTKGEALTITVPVVLVGTAPGVREGGDLMQPLHELEVRCLPKDLPGHIEVDVSGLNVGDAVHIGDLAVPGVEIHGDPALPVALVVGKKAEALEEGEAGLVEEGAAEAEEAEG